MGIISDYDIFISKLVRWDLDRVQIFGFIDKSMPARKVHFLTSEQKLM